MGKDPWAAEGEKHSQSQAYADIRDLSFKDNHVHNVRCLPQKDEKTVPFWGYIIHWIPQANSKKGRPIIHEIEKRCIVCEHVSDLWNEINRLKEEEDLTDNSPEVKKVYSRIQAIGGKRKYDFNVLDRDNMEHKIDKKTVIAAVRMPTPQTVWKPIFDFAKNVKWGNPADAETGYNFEITTEGEGGRRQYTVAPDRDASPLTEEEKAALETCYDLKKLRKTTSIKDMKDILENAKTPYNELLNLLLEEPKGRRVTEKVEKSESTEIEEPEEKEEKVVEKVEKKEEVEEKVEKEEVEEKVEKKEEVEKHEVEEPKDDEEKSEEVVEEVDNNDDNDLNSYECKGEYEKGVSACDDCPVLKKCIDFLPTFEKARKLGIGKLDEKSIDQIIGEIEEVEGKAPKDEEKPKIKGKRKGKTKTNLPF